MPKFPELAPRDLADLAEAALALGQTDAAEALIGQAYDRAGGEAPTSPEALLARLRRAAEHSAAPALTERQRRLLRLPPRDHDGDLTST